MLPTSYLFSSLFSDLFLRKSSGYLISDLQFLAEILENWEFEKVWHRAIIIFQKGQE